MDIPTASKIEKWLTDNFDSETKKQIQSMQQSNTKELEDCFYKNLEFGTGGIRGVMGIGTNRINRYTIGFVTQGISNYMKSIYTSTKIKIAIAYDSRNNSKLFAQTVANILAANGCTIFIFEDLRPTPELSFTIRHLNCHAGVVITASHNPKEYNGYKVYWNDGAQIVEPHDKLITAEIEKIQDINQVLWNGNDNNINYIGKEVDDEYLKMITCELCLNKNAAEKQSDLKIVYTPIHGTGVTLIPQLLKQLGFKKVTIVEEQSTPNGNFPSVINPNPEEKEAMELGLALAKKIDADILMGTDPDSDRIGIGIKTSDEKWLLLNGNQIALLALNYCIEVYKKNNINFKDRFIAKTIVTTDLIDIIAKKNSINCYSVLTGFKWIASLITENEGQAKFIAGAEESYGLLIGDKVRDKDAISAVAIYCEMAAHYKNEDLSLYDVLLNIYKKYGFYYENLISITKKGIDGQKEIDSLMHYFRNNIPKTICGLRVVSSIDYKTGEKTYHIQKKVSDVSLPKADVLQIILEDNSKISFRPSGTEPKIKYYISVNIEMKKDFNYERYVKKSQEKINKISSDLRLM